MNRITISGISIEIEEINDDTILIHLKGYIDTYNSNDFINFIYTTIEQYKDHSDFLLELSGVSYMSSTGVGAIISMMKQLKPEKSLKLFNVTKTVKDIMSLLGFTEFFEFHKDLEKYLKGKK